MFISKIHWRSLIWQKLRELYRNNEPFASIWEPGNPLLESKIAIEQTYRADLWRCISLSSTVFRAAGDRWWKTPQANFSTREVVQVFQNINTNTNKAKNSRLFRDNSRKVRNYHQLTFQRRMFTTGHHAHIHQSTSSPQANTSLSCFPLSCTPVSKTRHLSTSSRYPSNHPKQKWMIPYKASTMSAQIIVRRIDPRPSKLTSTV